MATKGHSTKFEYGDGDTVAGSSNWTPFAKVTEITPPNVEAEDIDVSHMESPDQFDEFDPGWATAADVECTIQFDNDENETVYGLFRVPKGFRMTFSNGAKWQFSGYIKGFGNEVERKGVVSAKVTVKLSGKPEYIKAEVGS